MSRSYKKTPSCHISRKARANRSVRRAAKAGGVPDGSAYKRLFSSYDIAGWHQVHTTYGQHRRMQERLGTYVGERQCREDYERFYRRK